VPIRSAAITVPVGPGTVPRYLHFHVCSPYPPTQSFN
jgi:hypothetical protein